jgi:hypothetical protein
MYYIVYMMNLNTAIFILYNCLLFLAFVLGDKGLKGKCNLLFLLKQAIIMDLQTNGLI